MFIFQIFKIKKIIREGKENPSKFAGEEMGDIVKGIFIIPLILVGTSALVSLLLGYTTVIFGLGPFGFFKFTFWFFVIIEIIIYILMRKITRMIQNKGEQTAHAILDK